MYERYDRDTPVFTKDRSHLSQAETAIAARGVRYAFPFHRSAKTVSVEAQPRLQPSRIRVYADRGLAVARRRAGSHARTARAVDDVREQLRDRAARPMPLSRPLARGG